MIWRLNGRVRGRELAQALGEGEHTVGSDRMCSVRLRDSTVSRRHAVLRVATDGIEVEDLGSKNGTWVGSERVDRRMLESGMGIRFGMVDLELQQLAIEDAEVAIPLSEAREPDSTLRSGHPETEEATAFDDWLEHRLPELLRSATERDPLELAAEGGASLAALDVVDRVRIERLNSSIESEGPVLFQSAAGGDPASPRWTELRLRLGAFEASVWFAARALAPRVETAARGLLVALQVAQADEVPAIATATTEGLQLPEPTTNDPGLLAIYEQAARAARSEIPTLVSGETGSGKELLVRFLHQTSPRRDGPLLDINCAALPRDLLEAELFGIEKGVATGVEPRSGRFEQAHGGTLFLDEIADMPLETQAMILRVLQEGEVRRIGSARSRPADVLVISATNQHLDQAIAEGRFRRDLYYRLAGWTVEVPPLRERHRDLPSLASWFAGREARRLDKNIQGISRAALDRLTSYDWPGNVRQLQQEICRAVAFTPRGALIDTRSLSPEVLAGPSDGAESGLAARLQRTEKIEIERALQRARGDVEEAAQGLGISRATLYRRLKSLGIEAP